MNNMNEFYASILHNVREEAKKEERERIIKLIEDMTWRIYQGVAHDGTILNLPTPKLLDREEVIALIKGENK